MTICIAAIGHCKDFGKDCEAIVFATDHMITLQNIGQFEHAIEKFRKIGKNSIIMLSGQAFIFEKILNGISEDEPVNVLAENIHKNLVNIRDEIIKSNIFDKLKIDHKYLKEVLKLPQHNETINKVLNYIEQLKLQTSIILAGFMKGKAQIYEVNEFTIMNTRDINFDAIGTGGIQAINTLLFQRHSKDNDLKITLYNVYKAKRNSEVSVGVGKETDLIILLPDGSIKEIDEKNLKILENIYNNEMKYGKENKDLTKLIKKLGE